MNRVLIELAAVAAAGKSNQRQDMNNMHGICRLAPPQSKRHLAWLLIATLVLGSCAASADSPQRDLPERFQGNPPICPRWAFAPWVWEDNGNTRESTLGLINGYKKHSIPVGAVIIDSPWSTAYNSFEWDTSRYPRPQEFIDKLKSMGVRVVVWITGAMNSESKDTPQNKVDCFNWLADSNLVVNDGEQYEWWKGKGVHLDFTNPDAAEWFGDEIEGLANMGIDGWKVDQSDDHLEGPVKTSIGVIAKSEFKPYYYGAIQELALDFNPESLIFCRPYSHQGGYNASINKCTVGWGGDYTGSFAGLRNQMHDLYQSARSGYGALAVEVGGFWKQPPSKLTLIRYVQFGALMPVMCNGGMNGGLKEHLPWHHGEKTVAIYRYYATLHNELAPYIFSCSVDSHLTGEPMVAHADEDRAQHMLGPQLFASPLVSNSTEKAVSLPATDRWIDYWDEEAIYEPGDCFTTTAPIEEIPLYIRAGAIIPMNVVNDVTGHGNACSDGRQTMLVYPCGESDFLYHRPKGAGIDYDDIQISVNEHNGTVEVDGTVEVAYRFRIKCFSQPEEVANADSWRYDAKRNWLIIDRRGSSFTFGIKPLQGYETR